MASKVKREAKEFTKIILTQLLRECVEFDSHAKLEVAFRESVSTLPDGPLKNELRGDFKCYFDTLKRKLAIPAKVVKQRNVAKVSEVAERQEQPFCLGAVRLLVPGGLDSSLTAVQEMAPGNERQKTYEKLVAAVQSSETYSEVVLQWSSDLAQSSITDCLSAVRFCSAISSSSSQTAVPWLQFCFEVFSDLMERAHENCAEEKDEWVETLREAVMAVLIQSHMRHPQPEDSDRYQDLLSAVLSLYIDIYCSSISSEQHTVDESSTDHLMTTVYTLLGNSHSHCLDAVLQASPPSSSAAAKCLLPVIRKILRSHAAFQNPSHYIKYICCYHQTSLWGSLISQEDVAELKQLVFQAPAPTRLQKWLWNKSPSLCKRLGLKESWLQKKTVSHLLRKLKIDFLEKLLDVAGGMGVADEVNDGNGRDERMASPEEEESGSSWFYIDDVGEVPGAEEQQSGEGGGSEEDTAEVDNVLLLLSQDTSTDIDQEQGDSAEELSAVENDGEIPQWVVTRDRQEGSPESSTFSVNDATHNLEAGSLEVGAHPGQREAGNGDVMIYFEDKEGKNRSDEGEISVERHESGDCESGDITPRRSKPSQLIANSKSLEEELMVATPTPYQQVKMLSPRVLRRSTRRLKKAISPKTPLDHKLVTPLRSLTSRKKRKAASELTMSVPSKRRTHKNNL